MLTTLFTAMSADGFIATKNGSEHFLSDENWRSFAELVQSHQNVIMGRKAYEATKNWDEDYGFDDFKDATKIIVSSDPDYSVDDGFILAGSPAKALEVLKEQGFSNTLLAGGSGLNASFAEAGLIDELILNIEPVFIGDGIPLFASSEFDLKLKLFTTKNLTDGIIQMRYRVTA